MRPRAPGLFDKSSEAASSSSAAVEPSPAGSPKRSRAPITYEVYEEDGLHKVRDSLGRTIGVFPGGLEQAQSFIRLLVAK